GAERRTRNGSRIDTAAQYSDRSLASLHYDAQDDDTALHPTGRLAAGAKRKAWTGTSIKIRVLVSARRRQSRYVHGDWCHGWGRTGALDARGRAPPAIAEETSGR